MTGRRMAVGGVLAIAAMAMLAGPALAQRDSDLRELRERIQQSRERVGELEREERELLDVLEELDRSLASLRRELVAARGAARSARQRADTADVALATATDRLAKVRRAMSRRVVALYKAGEVGPVRALFSATSLQDMLGRVSALRTLVASDADLVDRFRREATRMEEAQSEAAAAIRERDAALRRLTETEEAQAEERASRRKVLASVHTHRGQERALLVEMERAARALEETVERLGNADLRGESLDGSGFAARRGALDPPVTAKLVEGFGKVVDSEFNTETFRKGVEFAAPRGTSVRAVAKGEVRFADWFRGYGRIVIVDHGDGYFTVYGHLDEIDVEVGEGVSEGDTVGKAGDTGSLAGPRLYFEIRRGSEPLDPSGWLRRGAGTGGAAAAKAG